MQLIKILKDKQWIIYSKQPFGGSEQVLEYLSHYAHRVAITNNRIVSIENVEVTIEIAIKQDGQ